MAILTTSLEVLGCFYLIATWFFTLLHVSFHQAAFYLSE